MVTIFLVIAVALFLLDTISVAVGRVKLLSLGLFFFALAFAYPLLAALATK